MKVNRDSVITLKVMKLLEKMEKRMTIKEFNKYFTRLIKDFYGKETKVVYYQFKDDLEMFAAGLLPKHYEVDFRDIRKIHETLSRDFVPPKVVESKKTEPHFRAAHELLNLDLEAISDEEDIDKYFNVLLEAFYDVEIFYNSFHVDLIKFAHGSTPIHYEITPEIVEGIRECLNRDFVLPRKD